MTSRSGKATPPPRKKPAPGRSWFFLFTLSPAHHWDIITTRRFINPGFTMRSWLPYVLEAIFLGFFVFFYSEPLQEILQFHRGVKILGIDPLSVRMLGGAGFYFILAFPVRLAILRHHRMPQIVEWLSCYFGFAWAAVFFLFGGLLLQAYAGIEGYHRCFFDDFNNYAVYTQDASACPAFDTWRRAHDFILNGDGTRYYPNGE